MRLFLNFLLAILIIGMLFAIIMEGVVIRKISDNHLWARQGICDIGQFLVDPCQPDEAFDAFIKYENLEAATGVLISYLQTCDNPDEDFLEASVEELKEAGYRMYYLEVDIPNEIDAKFLEDLRDELMDSSGWYGV